ncbi:MAG: PKD domain-containing protein [Bacteroidetes bacterium]|nr:PKD domain-containing protein [Bacteroidota bacterium]
MKTAILFTLVFCLILYAFPTSGNPPSASFTASDSSGCIPFTVYFNNLSLNASSCYWDFGNGSTSTLANPSVIFNYPGNYSITLIVTGQSGMTDTLKVTNLIHAFGRPVAGFAIPDNTGCVNGNPVQFNNNTSGANLFIWDFGDGTTSSAVNPSHVYTTPGNFSITLIAITTSGCSDVKVMPGFVVIAPNPAGDFSVDTTKACDLNVPFTFTSSVTNATGYLWNFGDGTASAAANPVHNYLATGKYSITLTASNTNGCSKIITKQNLVSVSENITPNISVSSTSGCVPLFIAAYGSPGGNFTYSWDFGDGNTATGATPAHTYNDTGNFDLELTVTDQNGCVFSKTSAGLVHAFDNIKVNFNADSITGCRPLTVHFTPNIAYATSYLWDFGDGNNSTVSSPAHTYSTKGDYTVSLKVTNNSGCSSEKEILNYIHINAPTANFSVANPVGCIPLNVSFTSPAASGNAWQWNFGDGAGFSSVGSNLASHTYSSGDTFTVSMIVHDAQGCTDTVIKTDKVIAIAPLVAFNNPDTVKSCTPVTVTFDGSSIGKNYWSWDFGDGTTSTSANPQHVYLDNGIYPVTLSTASANNCPMTIFNYNVYKIEIPTVNFSFVQDSCPSYGVTYTDSSAGVQSWDWDFGDGSSSPDTNPYHQFSGPGNYSVSLTVTTPGGCNTGIVVFCKVISCLSGGGGQDSGEVSMGGWFDWISGDDSDSITALFDTISGCSPMTVKFLSPVDTVNFWLWDFGDSTTSTLENPVHTYTRNGIYTVTLIITSSGGYSDTLEYTRKIMIAGADAAFSYTQVNTCNGADVQFYDSWNTPSDLSWSFGDGTNSSTLDPSHSYYTPGNFLVIHEVSDSLGCHDIEIGNIYVGVALPVFTYPDSACAGDTVQFQSNIDNYASYLWDFGDGATSSDPFPGHSFINGGLFQVNVTVTGTNGCVTAYPLPGKVKVHNPVAGFSLNNPTAGCNSLTVNTSNLSTGSDSWLWEFGNGSTSAQKNPVYNYIQPGVYEIKLTATKGQCYSEWTYSDSLVVHYANADFNMVQNAYCLPVTVAFADLSYKPLYWKWYFGDSDSSSVQNPFHTYYNHPSGNVKLTVTDSNGCVVTRTKTKPAIFNPVVLVTDRQGCLPMTVTFDDNSPDAVTWQWDFGDGNQSVDENPVHIYSDTGYYHIILIALSNMGCSDTVLFDSLIYVQKVIAGLTSPSPMSGCHPLEMHFFDNSINADSWLWDFGDGNSSNKENPAHYYTSPGFYNVSLIASSVIGCSDTAWLDSIIEVKGPVAQFTMSNSAGCPPLQVSFTDSSLNAADLTWFFGEGDTSHSVNPVHEFSQPGDYFVTLFAEDKGGCTSYYTYPFPVNVYDVPDAKFSPSVPKGCVGKEIYFANNTLGGVDYMWDFGDGSSSSATDPVHAFAEPGSYTVSLIAKNILGCSDTVTGDTIRIFTYPSAGFTSDKRWGCSPLTVQFTGASSSLDDPAYLWDFGNGITSTGENPAVTFSQGGEFPVTLIVTNQGTCSDTLIKNEYINITEDGYSPTPDILAVSVVNDNTIRIIWNKSATGDFRSYILTRKNILTGNYDVIAVIPDAAVDSYSDNTVNTLHQSWCYKLQVEDTCGNAAGIEELTGHCTINVTAVAEEDYIHVTWTPYMGCTVSKYEILRGKRNEGVPEYYGEVDGNITQFDDTRWECNENYVYRIRATRLCGNNIFSESDSAIASPEQMSFVNQEVLLVRTTTVNNESTLTEWKEPELAPDKVQSFKIFRSYDGSDFSHYTTVPAGTFLFIDNNVDLDRQAYYYKVQPEYTCRYDSPKSNTGSSILLKGKTSMDHVELQWNPYSDWKKGVKNYIIERQKEDGTWEVVEIIDGNTTKFTDKVEE